ncbi:MAG TPA: phenylalanine--tRNA ligase subunit beta [Symbiobacteriaceae bacterium]|jgi:phenylalanyl-tRNA synthetase beta chain
MQVSYNWLKDYVDVDLSPAELAKALTNRGVVVEVFANANPGMAGVVVGKVVEIERHPDSDHLWVCQVDVGGKVLQILTGAQNVRQGDLVPAAIPGSKLPDGRTMEAKKLRGLESHGMLCSPIEIGMGDDADGILILPPDPSLEPGMDAAEVLGLNDWIFELDLTANYASHCQAMVGVAQEVAAILGESVDWPATYTEDEPNTNANRMIDIRIAEPDLCSRYTARIVRGVKVGESPAWLQARVRAAGMRPINNIVDISNFVMMELGQPLHTFDYARIRGRQIIVRRAAPGEPFKTLDGQDRVLDPDILVIADGMGPVAMAGVMGGLESEVTDGTTEILIESAHFNNINNRRTSLRMNLPSEAARRFTKGVDPSGCVRAADRAAQLIALIAGGKVVQGVVDVYPRPAVPAVIVCRTAKVNAHLGLQLSAERISEHLDGLGMIVLAPADLARDLATGMPEPEAEEGDDLSGRPVWTAMHQVSPVPKDAAAYAGWAETAWEALEAAGDQLESLGDVEALVVVAPTRRLDIAKEIDLVEEVARSEGYDKIPLELPVLESRRGGRTSLASIVLAARQALAGLGLDEIMTYSLTNPKVYDKLRLPTESPDRRVLTLGNPLYEEQSTLRTLLLPAVLDNLKYNANRQNRDLGVFEIGNVYRPVAGEVLPAEPRALAIALTGNQAGAGWNSPEQPADFFALKGIVEQLLDQLDVQGWSVGRSSHGSFHPGRQAELIVAGRSVGVFGEVHPDVVTAWDLPGRVYAAEFDFDGLVAAARPQRAYHIVPKFPAITRDVALMIGETVPAVMVAAAIKSVGELIEEVTLFDRYQGEHVKPGWVSLAYRITYRAADRTLTDADVEAVHGKVRAALQALGAELRS